MDAYEDEEPTDAQLAGCGVNVTVPDPGDSPSYSNMHKPWKAS